MCAHEDNGNNIGVTVYRCTVFQNGAYEVALDSSNAGVRRHYKV